MVAGVPTGLDGISGGGMNPLRFLERHQGFVQKHVDGIVHRHRPLEEAFTRAKDLLGEPVGTAVEYGRVLHLTAEAGHRVCKVPVPLHHVLLGDGTRVVFDCKGMETTPQWRSPFLWWCGHL